MRERPVDIEECPVEVEEVRHGVYRKIARIRAINLYILPFPGKGSQGPLRGALREENSGHRSELTASAIFSGL